MSAKVPKNVRFRPDQIAALGKLQNEETDFSALVRTAVDRYLQHTDSTARSSEESPVYKLEKAAKAFTKTKKRQAKRKSAA